MGCTSRANAAALFVFGAALLCGWTSAGQAANRHPTIAQVRRDVASGGATRTVQALWRAQRWDWIEDRVGAGDAGWIAMAPLLAPGTDAGTAEGLSISLAEGLVKDPSAVLAVLRLKDDVVLGVDSVCIAPFIEETSKHHAAYMRAAFRALARVNAPNLRRVKQACLEQLRQAR